MAILKREQLRLLSRWPCHAAARGRGDLSGFRVSFTSLRVPFRPRQPPFEKLAQIFTRESFTKGEFGELLWPSLNVVHGGKLDRRHLSSYSPAAVSVRSAENGLAIAGGMGNH